MLKAQDFNTVCEVVFGKPFISRAAAALGRNRRTVYSYASGQAPIPVAVAIGLQRVINARIAELQSWAHVLDGQIRAANGGAREMATREAGEPARVRAGATPPVGPTAPYDPPRPAIGRLRAVAAPEDGGPSPADEDEDADSEVLEDDDWNDGDDGDDV